MLGVEQYGQLGLGNARDVGRAARQMGANLPYVELGTGRTAQSLSLGYTHSCALLDDGSVKCWGENVGELGVGTRANVGDNPGEMAQSRPDPQSGRNLPCGRLQS